MVNFSHRMGSNSSFYLLFTIFIKIIKIYFNISALQLNPIACHTEECSHNMELHTSYYKGDCDQGSPQTYASYIDGVIFRRARRQVGRKIGCKVGVHDCCRPALFFPSIPASSAT